MDSTARTTLLYRPFLSYVWHTPALRDTLTLQGSAAIYFYNCGSCIPADLDFISPSIASAVRNAIAAYGAHAAGVSMLEGGDYLVAKFGNGLDVEICEQRGERAYRDVAVSPAEEIVADKIVALHRSMGKRGILKRKHIDDIAHLAGRIRISPDFVHAHAKRYRDSHWDRRTNDTVLESMGAQQADHNVMRIMERCFQ